MRYGGRKRHHRRRARRQAAARRPYGPKELREPRSRRRRDRSRRRNNCMPRRANRGLRQGRAHALRAAAERRILQTPRQGEEQQDQCQLNSLLHPVRIINFYAAKIHSFTQKSTLANQKDHKMTNFDYKSTNPRPAKNTVSYVGNGIRTPAGTAYFSAYRSPTTFQSTTPQRASTASARRFR